MSGVRARTWPGSHVLSAPVPPVVVWLGRAAGLLVFVVVVLVRGGPVSAQNDAQVVTMPTTAISHGQWARAERLTYAADPPGYPLVAAPVVAALRPVIGSPTWCTDRSFPSVAGGGPQAAFYRSVLHLCADQPARGRGVLPHWYRSQALLGVLAWVVLLAGTQLLLRVAHGRPTLAEAVGAVGVALLPAASDALVESYHPQDLLCVGLACVALSQGLRRRWVVVGLLFGLAVLCKQFAVLALLPVLVLAPAWRPRLVVLGAATGVVLLGALPFLVADPGDTVHALSGMYSRGAGVIRSSTAIGLLGVDESLKLRLARDLAVAAAALACLAAWWRRRVRGNGAGAALEPVPLIGLVLACLAMRLVFEVSILEYYLLAVTVFLLVLDLACGRPPVWTAAWVLATRYGVVGLFSVASPSWTAVAFMAVSLAAMAIGLSVLRPGTGCTGTAPTRRWADPLAGTGRT